MTYGSRKHHLLGIQMVVHSDLHRLSNTGSRAFKSINLKSKKVRGERHVSILPSLLLSLGQHIGRRKMQTGGHKSRDENFFIIRRQMAAYSKKIVRERHP